jgi:hypothetical protein
MLAIILAKVLALDDYNDYDECGAFDGMIGKGNRSTQRKLSPVPLCPPQNPHDLTELRTRATMMESRAVARPL